MIADRIVSGLVTALVLTAVIEAACGFIIGIRSRRGQLVILLANLITNPLLNCILILVSFYISPSLFYYCLVPLEIIVILAEGAIYRSILRPRMQPFLLSAVLNSCSLFLGTGILYILHH